MAIAPTCVWEVRTTGSNTNGGGYVPGGGGLDYSQQPTAQYTLTGVTGVALSDTVASASASSDMVGNIAYFVSGTNFIMGFYEIISVVAGVSIRFDRAVVGASNGTSGVINIGGSFKIGGTQDDNFFEAITGGNIVWIKSGTYTPGMNVSVSSAASTSTNPSFIIGYDVTRGDNPTGSGRPLIMATAMSFGQYQNLYYLSIQGTVSGICSLSTGGKIKCCKVYNSSSTPNRTALTLGTDGMAIGCEVICVNGTAISLNSTSKAIGCYCHDSNVGFAIASTRVNVSECITHATRTAGINNTTFSTSNVFKNITMHGFATPRANTYGLLIGATPVNVHTMSCIITGQAVGISGTTSQKYSNAGCFNIFYNNTANAALYTLDVSDQTGLDPAYGDVSEISGSTATSAGSVLTDSSADFTSVVDGEDFLHIFSGTGVTVGVYPILSHTATTITSLGANPLGTSSAGNIVYTITHGRNFAISSALKAEGFPSLFYGSNTTSYIDPGAVQRQEPTGGGGSGETSTISLL